MANVALGIALDEARVAEQKLRELRERALRHDETMKKSSTFSPVSGFERPKDEDIEDAAANAGEMFTALLRRALGAEWAKD
jgi:hypothetical protein